MTPLGEMPNTLILVNGIHSLLEYNTIELPSMWFEILLMSMLIIIMTWVLLMFHSFLGMIMSGVAVITCIILPVNIFLFRYGIWLDFVLPLIVVQFYLIASRFEEMRKLQSSKR
jgi:CHASE2 domain-containing sensor protein